MKKIQKELMTFLVCGALTMSLSAASANSQDPSIMQQVQQEQQEQQKEAQERQQQMEQDQKQMQEDAQRQQNDAIAAGNQQQEQMQEQMQKQEEQQERQQQKQQRDLHANQTKSPQDQGQKHVQQPQANAPKDTDKKIRDKAYRDYKHGMKPEVIAKKYNVPVSTVQSWSDQYWKSSSDKAGHP